MLSAVLPGGVFLCTAPSAAWAQTQSEALFFASDIHSHGSDAVENDDGPFNLKRLMATACTAAEPCETVGLVGDYGYDGSTTAKAYSAVQRVVADAVPSPTTAIYAQGNHDQNGERTTPGLHSHPTGLVSFSGSNQYYDVFVINASDFAVPQSGIPAALDQLDSLAESCSSSERALFVMSHYPLHSTRGDINQAAALWVFDRLSKCAEKGRDVVFLWGHNHRGSFDQGVSYIAKPDGIIGGSVSVNAVATAKLGFTYVNAGYANPQNNQIQAAASKIVVSPDQIVVSRYEAGKQNPVQTQTIARKPNLRASIHGSILPSQLSAGASSPLRAGFTVTAVGAGVSATSNELGEFELSGLSPGTYDVEIAKSGFLVRGIASVQCAAGTPVSLGTVEMWAGDINGDGAINMTDVMQLAGSFNTVVAGDPSKAALDLNQDGAINMQDVMILAGHFNTATSSYPSLTPATP